MMLRVFLLLLTISNIIAQRGRAGAHDINNVQGSLSFASLSKFYFGGSFIDSSDSLFLSTDKPAILWEDNPVTLGMKFTTSGPGVIKVVKFYKTDSRSDKTYEIGIWDNGNIKLTMVPVTTTATGWIRVPVNIAVGGGTFIIGVYNPYGRYGFRNSVYPRTKGQLSGISGTFETGNAIPTKGSNSCYYLDLVFSQTIRKPLIVNAGIDTAAVWPCDSIKLNGIATGDGVRYNWTIDNTWGVVSITGANLLSPVVYFKEPDSGAILILTATDEYGVTSEHGVSISVMPDFDPYIKRFGQLIMNQLRFEMIRKWKAGE